MLDGYHQPLWVERILGEIAASSIAELSLVILNGGDASTVATGPVRRRSLGARVVTWYRNRRALPWALLERLEARRSPPESPAATMRDLAPLLAGVPVVAVTPRRTVHCDYFPDEACDGIATFDLDVCLRFGFRILKGRSLQVARHGVWSFHHGDNRVNRGGPPGFWEVAEGHATTGAVLQRLSEELDGGTVLGRVQARTEVMSYALNRANYYAQAVPLVMRELRRLHALGPEAFARSAHQDRDPSPWQAYGGPLYRAPTTAAVAGFVLARAVRTVRRRLRHALRREQWILGWTVAKDATPDVPSAVGFRFREIVPPADRYWADPFPVEHEGRYYVFFEEHPYASRDAHIAMCELDPRHGPGPATVVLARDYHLSYPSVFQWEGAWYMMPETRARRAVELFRAVEFPTRWEFDRTLVEDIDAVDPTVAFIDGHWWLFVGVELPGAIEASALHVYRGPSPLGPWTPHRYNPVKIDTVGARPGGRIFADRGVHYRPGQVGTPHYGAALVVHRIDRLTLDEFQETPVTRLDPLWRPGLRGVHTLNSAGRLTMVDMLHAPRRL